MAAGAAKAAAEPRLAPKRYYPRPSAGVLPSLAIAPPPFLGDVNLWQSAAGFGRVHMRLTLAATLLAGSVALGSGVEAQQLDKKEFNVIGTWNFLTPWKDLEVPFWTKDLPEASGGNLKGNIKSVTEVNLKGTEVLAAAEAGRVRFRGGVADLRRGRRRHHRGRRYRRRRAQLQDEPRDDRRLDGRNAKDHEGAPQLADPGLVHLAGAELLLQGRHQEHRGPEGQEDPRAGHLAGRSGARAWAPRR